MIDARIVSSRMVRAISLGIDTAVSIYWQESHIESVPFAQMLERVQDRMMFGCGANQVPATARVSLRETENGQVIRFGAAPGKN